MPPGAVPGSICSDHDEYHDIVAKTLTSLDVPQVAQDFGDSHSVAHYCQTRSKTRPTDQDEFYATDWRSPIPADTHRDSIHFRVAPSCCTSSQICVSDQDECDVTAMKFPIPADTHSIPSHGTATGRKGETGCGARSSRDGLTADLECDGTHYNFPVTLESGEAIEDMTKDDVEHLVVMLREVVDVLYRRQEGELILVVDTMIDRLINGVTGKYIRRKTRHPPNSRILVQEPSTTISRRTTATAIREAWKHSSTAHHLGTRHPTATEACTGPKCGHVPSPPKGTVTLLATMAPLSTLGRMRSRTTTLTWLEGAACASSARCTLYHSPARHNAHSARTTARTCSGAKDAATSRALSATTPRSTAGVLAARALTRTDSLHPPCTQSDPAWCTGGGDGSGRWVGRMGTHIQTEWMVLCGGVDLSAFTEGLGANFEPSSSSSHAHWTHRATVRNFKSSCCLRVDTSDTLHNSCVTFPCPESVLANSEQSCH